MKTAVGERKQTQSSLVEALETLIGRSLPAELVRAYKTQQLVEMQLLYGIEAIDLDDHQPFFTPVQIRDLVLELMMPWELCTRYQLLPLQHQGTTVVVAMVEPENLAALDDLQRRLRNKNLTLVRVAVTSEDYQLLLMRAQAVQALAAPAQTPPETAQEVMDYIETLSDRIDLDDETNLDLAEVARQAEDAPIIKLSNSILLRAISQRVSDIHLEPQEEELRIRFRKDGVLREAPVGIGRLPKRIIPALISRFKIMADLNIAERRLPQDGRIRRVYQQRTIDFRVSSLPSRHGEKIVLRLLDNTDTQLSLDRLITDAQALSLMREIFFKPYGLVLVTGPTGSGKTTTLYAALAELNQPAVNITTAEDPIEYMMPGISQVQVVRDKGLDFARILRAVLRQDPDVMLVGETRDLETAKTVVEAALTGHLVLSTLHTNDAPSAIARLTQMGVAPFLIASSLIGIISQRLLRRVCPNCRQPYRPEVDRLRQFGLIAAREQHIIFYRALSYTPQEVAQQQPDTLCAECHGVGYLGRVGVYEVMRLTPKLRAAINCHASTEHLRESAVEEGMTTLLAYSLNLVRSGQTTLEEVERVTLADSGLELGKRRVLVCHTCEAELCPEWLDCPYCTTPRLVT